MAMQLGHVHVKTRDDPQKVAKFYIDNFGATLKRENPGRRCQLDLHGVQLNVTTINPEQNSTSASSTSRSRLMTTPMRWQT
jgi:extradiol dioxygenase family protein